MRLYGTLTSPYVRRVRIVATEIGVPCELVAPDAALLHAVTPIWKVPGFAFSASITSFSVLACTLTLAVSADGTAATSVMPSATKATSPAATS